MKIAPISTDIIDQYFILAQKKGTVFNKPEWSAIYGDLINHYGFFNNDNKLVGGFFLYNDRKMGLSHLNNPPYTPHIGLFYDVDAKNKANLLSNIKSVITLLAEFIEGSSYKILTIALPSEYIDLQPFFWKGFKVIPNYTYRHKLKEHSIEELQIMMSPERRNDIKKAAKDGILTQATNDYKIVKELIVKTFSRKEKSLNENLIERILFQFANEENSFAFISSKNSIPMASSFCIHNGHTVYYLLGGYDNANKHQGAGAAAVWEAIKYAKEVVNATIFDFEGSMIMPVEKYFRAFGADLVPYYTINKAALPIEMVLKLIKREVF